MRKNVLLFTLSLMTVAGVLIAGPGQADRSGNVPLNVREFRHLFICSLEKADLDWLWADSEKKILVTENDLGTYLGGAQAFRWDSRMPECLQDYLSNEMGMNEGHDWTYGFSLLSGLPVYAPRQGSQNSSDKINYFNPALINWITQNAIPSPSDSFTTDETFQDLYNTVFKRNVQILALSYRELQERKTYAKLTEQYRNASDRERVQMKYELLQDVSFNDRHSSEENDPYGYYFDSGHAAAFWLRRGLDETNDEVWKLLKTVSQKYDKSLFSEISKID